MGARVGSGVVVSDTTGGLVDRAVASGVAAGALSLPQATVITARNASAAPRAPSRPETSVRRCREPILVSFSTRWPFNVDRVADLNPGGCRA